MQEARTQLISSHLITSSSPTLQLQLTSDSMENLTSENHKEMTDIVETLEGDVNVLQSHTPPTSTPPTGNKEKNPKPLKQLKPQKTGVDVKRHRKLTSKVWEHFEFLDNNNDEDDELHCKCKKCGQVYNAETRMGTGNLKRHVQKCKKGRFKDIGQMVLDIGGNGGSITSRVPEFDPNTFREMLATAIVRHDLPFQFVDYEGIRKCFSYLNPEVKVVKRNTIKAEILNIYKREKLRIKETLSCIPGRICLTSDCWSSITTDGYLSLTAHFVDSSWRLRRMILNFSFLPPPHTGLAMSDHVFGLLKDWGIQKKVFSITLDNASANDAMVDYLKTEIDLICGGAYFHVRCCAHILNLIVQDGLKEVDAAVIKVRETVKYFKGSQYRKKNFLKSVAHVELQSVRGLRQDVPTRWNSTYLMLDSVLYYKKAFIHLQKTDANYLHCPTTEEWGRVERIFKFLKVFYEVTCAFSGTTHPTTNIYFANVLMVRVLLHKENDSHDRFMQKMASRMYVKFEKYWDEFSTIMAVAAVLDPRYKFQIVEWGYEKAYGEKYQSELVIIRAKLFSLFNEYLDESKVKNSKDGEPTNSSLNSQEGTQNALESASLLMDFDNFSTKVTSQAVKSELECYLEEKLMPRVGDLNILDYWRTHEIRYPTIARMARDILAIPISTVASESAFSTGGRVLDAYRSSLKPSNVEAIICLRDWVYGEAKMEAQVEDLCGALMEEKIDDDDDDMLVESQSGVGDKEK